MWLDRARGPHYPQAFALWPGTARPCRGMLRRNSHSSSSVFAVRRIAYDSPCTGACVRKGVRNARPQHLFSRDIRHCNRAFEHGVHFRCRRGRGSGMVRTAANRPHRRRLRTYWFRSRLRVQPVAYLWTSARVSVQAQVVLLATGSCVRRPSAAIAALGNGTVWAASNL
jgi:hypothetical protein